MRRLEQITPLNFPPAAAPNYRAVTELTITTKKYGACGGSFWLAETHGRGPVVRQDADGYHWAVPEIHTLERDGSYVRGHKAVLSLARDGAYGSWQD